MMGHSEYFYFIDPRVGVDGTELGAPTRALVKQLATDKGYSGPVQVRVTAYPPKPQQAVLNERAMREQFGYTDGDIPW